jgi:hypothetical protein
VRPRDGAYRRFVPGPFRHGLRRLDQIDASLESGYALHRKEPAAPHEIFDVAARQIAGGRIPEQVVERPIRGGDRDRRGGFARERGGVLAPKFIAMIDVHVVAAEARDGPGGARHQNELIVEKNPAREIVCRLGHEAEGQIDEAGLQPAVDLKTFPRPERERDFRLMATQVFEEALSNSLPKIEFQTDVANPFEPLGKRYLVASLAPELRHHLGVALEFESRRGQFRAGLAAMQELLSDFLFQRVQPGRDRRLRDVQPARSGDEAACLDDLQEGA